MGCGSSSQVEKGKQNENEMNDLSDDQSPGQELTKVVRKGDRYEVMRVLVKYRTSVNEVLNWHDPENVIPFSIYTLLILNPVSRSAIFFV